MNTREAILRLAGIVPEHNLKEVQALPNFNTWGVDSRPGQLPSILYIGEGSRDFGAPCWPFMAAHEAMHSIATLYLQTDDYRFVLYNICEDWRVNQCLLGMFYEKLNKSFKETRQTILRRWEKEPLKLKSPVSQVLQHLCYLNHLSEKEPTLPVSDAYLKEVLRIREQFGSAENWPLVPPRPERVGALRGKRPDQRKTDKADPRPPRAPQRQPRRAAGDHGPHGLRPPVFVEDWSPSEGWRMRPLPTVRPGIRQPRLMNEKAG